MSAEELGIADAVRIDLCGHLDERLDVGAGAGPVEVGEVLGEARAPVLRVIEGWQVVD